MDDNTGDGWKRLVGDASTAAASHVMSSACPNCIRRSRLRRSARYRRRDVEPSVKRDHRCGQLNPVSLGEGVMVWRVAVPS